MVWFIDTVYDVSSLEWNGRLSVGVVCKHFASFNWFAAITVIL